MKPKHFFRWQDRRSRQLGLTLILISFLALPSTALAITWQGGNVEWVDGGSTANWNPADEPDVDDPVVFNTSNTVNLGSGNSILSLTMSNGISLLTNNSDLTINGLLQLVDAGTDLTIEGVGSLVLVDSVTINTGADIILDDGALSVVEESGVGILDINTGGILTGQGNVNLRDVPGVVTTLLVNSGTISVAPVGLVLGAQAAGTLAINVDDVANARVDLDGPLAGMSVVNVFRNQTLDINAQLLDPYSADLNLFHNSTIDVSVAWGVDAGATVDVDNGFVNNGGFLDIPASTSFISGGAFIQTGGDITVVDGDGTLQFNAPFTMNGGNLVNNGKVVFNANSTIGAAANFTMPTSTSSLTVNAGVVVNVNQTVFNADGNGTATNVITIGSGGILDIDMGVGGETGIGSTFNLNGGELDVTTNTDLWSVNGAINVGAATGTSTINGEAVTFSSVPVTVGNGSILDVNPNSTWASTASASIGTGSTLRIDGLGSELAGASFTGAGTLVFGSTSTTTASTSVSTNTFDWDGAGTGTTHTINDGAVFTVTSPNFDSDGDMDDGITLGGNGAGISISGPTQWAMNHTITTNTADTGIATIGGTSRLVLTTVGGVLNANGNTTISAPVTFGAESTVNVAAPAVLTLSGNSIYQGVTIDGAGRFNPPSGNNNTVADDSVIGTTNFNFDQGNWLIQPGATLSVSVTDYDPDAAAKAFNSAITLQSSELNVISGDPFFVMDGVLNLSNTTDLPAIWTGETLQIGNDTGTLDADINVGGTGNSSILPQVTFNSDADVNIAADASLSLNGIVNFDSVNAATNAEFTGAGTLVTSAQVNFNEATTLNMTGGTVDLDGTDSVGSTIHVDAPVTINVATLSSFGKLNIAGTNIIEIDSLSAGATGLLAVNLDNPASQWTLNPDGILNLLNDAAAAPLLSGSDVTLRGTVNVTGDVRSDARFDLTGIINILTAAEFFRLGGGNNSNNPNTIAGGMINGPGTLGDSFGRALVGHGIINSNIDVGVSSDVLADGGTLHVTTTGILGVRAFGTADLDGTLNVIPDWDAVNVNTVQMAGGVLQGGRILVNNANGIRGHGLVSAQIVNNTSIQANSVLAPLIIETAVNNNDWDGTGVGVLQAVNSSTLEIRDTAVFGFTGTVSASGGGTVFANGFELDMTSAPLNLANGTFRQSGGLSTDLGSAITIGAGTSRLLVTAPTGGFVFESTSNTNLTGNLQLDAPTSSISAGATFGGAGHLINLATRRLVPDNLATINALVENRGILAPGSANAARNDFVDFTQALTGVLEIDVRGTLLGNFDRVLISGSAQLSGVLQLAIGGGYVPAFNDTFTVLSATGGVSGTFASVVKPAGMPAGLSFSVIYNPNNVQIRVVSSSVFDLWIAAFNLLNPADRIKAADPDFDGISNLGELALDGNPASGASTGKIVGKIASVGGVNAMTLSLPVRNGAIPDGADPLGGELVLKQAADGLTYRLQASDDLTSFGLEVTEVIGVDATAIQEDLPGLTTGWIYRTFRSPGGVSGDPSEFMRVVITE